MIRPHTCPICRKALPVEDPQQVPTFPFCSDRCRKIDFFRWTDGKYAIVEPLTPMDEEFDAEG